MDHCPKRRSTMVTATSSMLLLFITAQFLTAHCGSNSFDDASTSQTLKTVAPSSGVPTSADFRRHKSNDDVITAEDGITRNKVRVHDGDASTRRPKRQPFRPPPGVAFFRWSRKLGDVPEYVKRVIFPKCPFFSCPKGYLCDSDANACRPIFTLDYGPDDDH